MAENGFGDTIKGPNIKRSPEKYTKKFDLNEIKPLDSEAQINVMISNDVPDDSAAKPQKTNKIKGTCEQFLTKLDISKKSKPLFFILIAIILVLLVVLILLTVFWPNIPYFMTADICVEKECLESSAQILLWANTSADTCHEPYEWACGKFKEDYLNHEFYGKTEGEWNEQAYADYNDISKIQAFVGKLKPTRQSSKVQLLLTGLYTSCMSLESLDKSQGDSELSKAIIYLSGWTYGEKETNIRGVWIFKEALTILHSQFGIFPFFKVSIENKNSAPFGSIITISEGEVGLPHKRFYNYGPQDKLIQAYRMLLRDFAINFGVVSDKARKFSDDIFYYEQRIADVTPNEKESAIMSLAEVQKLAQNLPITESIKEIFSEIEINDRTEILVRGTEMLREMANIVSSSTEPALNNFIIWSLTRHFLPFMSREYRSTLEEFENVLYGFKSPQPKWYFCSKLLKNWIPFALSTLQRKPELLQATTEKQYSLLQHVNLQHQSDSLHAASHNNRDHNLLKLIFYHLRDQLKQAIISNPQWDKESSDFVISMLTDTRLQIGIPNAVLNSDNYLNNYYRDYLVQNLHFSDNIERNWSFRKKKMQHQLKFNNETERIIAQLFPISEDHQQRVKFSVDINMIIVSEEALNRPNFNFKYPIAVNFARIGFDISQALLQAIFLFGEQYKEQQYSRSFGTDALKEKRFTTESTDCFERHLDEDNIEVPHTARTYLISEVLSGRFTSNALQAFIRNVNTNTPVPEALLHDGLSYSQLGLVEDRRQVGLRQYDHNQLFTLAFLQRSCGYAHNNYYEYKPFIKGKFDDIFRFRKLWDLIPSIPDSLNCPRSTKC